MSEYLCDAVAYLECANFMTVEGHKLPFPFFFFLIIEEVTASVSEDRSQFSVATSCPEYTRPYLKLASC